ncbi:MAG: hypothetical protein MjAS7_1950 [Metallosphaera javensis (ex Sakai et al. 2022)]|nr:MAG: hypothetical protein MjAS7_1950 [Metallosphaera javensis (ex Sakai et al. 2022)]
MPNSLDLNVLKVVQGYPIKDLRLSPDLKLKENGGRHLTDTHA